MFTKDEGEYNKLLSEIKPGKWYKMKGSVAFNTRSNDYEFSINDVESYEKKVEKIEVNENNQQYSYKYNNCYDIKYQLTDYIDYDIKFRSADYINSDAIKTSSPSEYDKILLSGEFILVKLLDVDCRNNMNIIENANKVQDMLHILKKSVQLVGIRGTVRLYRIPKAFIKHVVEKEDQHTVIVKDENKLNLEDIYKHLGKIYMYNKFDF